MNGSNEKFRLSLKRPDPEVETRTAGSVVLGAVCGLGGGLWSWGRSVVFGAVCGLGAGLWSWGRSRAPVSAGWTSGNQSTSNHVTHGLV